MCSNMSYVRSLEQEIVVSGPSQISKFHIKRKENAKLLRTVKTKQATSLDRVCKKATESNSKESYRLPAGERCGAPKAVGKL